MEFLRRYIIMIEMLLIDQDQPVWHVGVLLSQCHDDVPEVGEGLVDGLSLGEPHPLTAAVLDPLTASQVHQVEGPAAGLLGLGVLALDPQHEHGVTPAGPLVTESLGPGPVLPGHLDHGLDLVLIGHLLHLQVGYVNLGALGVAHLDLVLETGVSVQEVPDLLIVDLKEGSLGRVGALVLMKSNTRRLTVSLYDQLFSTSLFLMSNIWRMVLGMTPH